MEERIKLAEAYEDAVMAVRGASATPPKETPGNPMTKASPDSKVNTRQANRSTNQWSPWLVPNLVRETLPTPLLTGGRDNGSTTPESPPSLICFRCNEPGHKITKCPLMECEAGLIPTHQPASITEKTGGGSSYQVTVYAGTRRTHALVDSGCR